MTVTGVSISHRQYRQTSLNYSDRVLCGACAIASAARGMLSTDPAISVVVPVKNEAGNIAPLVGEIAGALQGHAFEIIYVNDGSRDATEAELLDLMVDRHWLRQIRHDSCWGQAAAIRTGVLFARAPVIVTLDGDLQNGPASIPGMVAALESGAFRLGLVAGQRIDRKASAFKRLQSRVANFVRAPLLGDGALDAGCGLKVFRREVFLLLPHFNTAHCFLPALMRREGLDVVYVDVVDRPRVHGRSKYGLLNRLGVGLIDMIGVWWLMRRTNIGIKSTELTLGQ